MIDNDKNKKIDTSQNKRSKTIKLVYILIAIATGFIFAKITDDFGIREWIVDNSKEDILLYPWDLEGKNPKEYTLDEYNKLTEEEKVAFENEFISKDDFDIWKITSQNIEDSDITLYPWDLEGKNPKEYTLDEYNKLTEEEKIAFENAFLSKDDFETWQFIVNEK